MNFLKQLKISKYTIAAGIIVFVALLFLLSYNYNSTDTRVYADREYYGVKVGDEVIAVFSDEQDAERVIAGVMDQDIEEGAEVQSVTCTPSVTVEPQTYPINELPKFSVVEDIIDFILTGTKEKVTYTIKDGDTTWDVAMDYGFSIDEMEEMNPGVDLEGLHPGDTLRLYEMKPLVRVTTVQLISSEKEIPYKTVTEKTDELLKNTTEVKQEGVNGLKMVEELVTTENGVVKSTEKQRSTVLKKAKKEIILEGTKEEPAPVSSSKKNAGSPKTYSDAPTHSGSGQDVANFALQFVGNPYVYGGSSLTNGADCSGFVMAVYAHFGISMAHDAGVMRSYGRGVSLSEAQPGDLVCYYGHVGIYIGGGQMVHASTESTGIIVSSTSYSGQVLTVRRIFE